MAICTIRRGFFILRECGRPATTSCTQCGRAACQEHGLLHEGAWYCVECAARQSDLIDQPRVTPYAYRRRYYTGRSDQPISRTHYHRYTDADYHAFDHPGGDTLEMADEGGGGFFES